MGKKSGEENITAEQLPDTDTVPITVMDTVTVVHRRENMSRGKRNKRASDILGKSFIIPFEVVESFVQFHLNLCFCGSEVKFVMMISCTPNGGKVF